MKKLANKMMRDGFENSVTNAFRKMYPNFEYEHRLRRLPLYPKIVLYSNVASVDRFMEKYLCTKIDCSPPSG